MAFWGVEVKPGKPVSHLFDNMKGRLRVSQATLNSGYSMEKSLVQCNVGDKSPVLLCALLPGKTESCHLDLEFEESAEVLFSVIGPRSVYLTGYYVDNAHHSILDNNSESYGEDIANTETENSNTCSEEDQYEDSFIDDGDVEVLPPSPRLSNEVGKELSDNKKPKGTKCANRRHGKKYQSIDSDDESNSRKQNFVNGSRAHTESEDEENIHLSEFKSKRSSNNKIAEAGEEPEELAVELGDKKPNDDVPQLISYGKDNPLDVNCKPKSIKPTKKRKKGSEVRTSDAKICNYALEEDKIQMAEAKSDTVIQDQLVRSKDDQKPAPDLCRTIDLCPNLLADGYKSDKKLRKKKKSKSKHQDNEEKGNIVVHEDNYADPSLQARTLSNGLIIEELKTGETGGKIAAPGRKVKVHYIGKLMESGEIFDSNIDKAPYKFRLGDQEVIEGWNVGLDGMHVGDKRRLTIPPSMGYGSEGAAEHIPPNAWLVYDVELVAVR